MPSKYARQTLSETPLETKKQAIKYGERMKTQQEIEEMAEKANKQIVEGFKRILPHIAGHKTAQDLIFEGIEELNNVIKGYQAAQEDKSLLNSILRHCDKYTNDADLGREVRKWMSKNL